MRQPNIPLPLDVHPLRPEYSRKTTRLALNIQQLLAYQLVRLEVHRVHLQVPNLLLYGLQIVGLLQLRPPRTTQVHRVLREQGSGALGGAGVDMLCLDGLQVHSLPDVLQ